MFSQRANNWSAFHKLSSDEQIIFWKGIDGQTDTCFTPVSVSAQVTNQGTAQYAFFCQAQVSLNTPSYPVLVLVLCRAGGNITLTHIQRLED